MSIYIGNSVERSVACVPAVEVGVYLQVLVRDRDSTNICCGCRLPDGQLSSAPQGPRGSLRKLLWSYLLTCVSDHVFCAGKYPGLPTTT